MENSIGVGFMAVFAVTGSVVILAHQINKRLLSDFMKDIEFKFNEAGLFHPNPSSRFGIGSAKSRRKKRVRFADDVVEPSSDNKAYRERHLEKYVISRVTNKGHGGLNLEDMPQNRQALYRGIIQFKGQQHVF